MKLSKYARLIELDGGTHFCLANTINKALVSLTRDRVDDGDLVDSAFAPDELLALESLGFFTVDEEGERLAREVASSPKRISTSIELSLECNLRCPYCYQGDDKVSRLIPLEVLSSFEEWVVAAIARPGVKELSVKVLGGEPSIRWTLIEPTLYRVYSQCKQRDIRFILMIDTNACFIEPFLSINYADKLLFTIPVTHESCHNSVRKDVSGRGTYDLTLRNAFRLQEDHPRSTIVLRHNTDEQNAPLFADYLDDLAKRGFAKPLVDLSYTASFQNTDYRNKLNYSDFLKWRFEKGIPALISHSFPVLISPTMHLNPCQRMERNSFKLFSDGTIGYCAMDFFSHNRNEVLSSLETADSPFFETRPKLPEKCFTCSSFFLCGGSYMLPCIQSLKVTPCEADGAFNVSFSDFVRLYMETEDKSLFVVFNQDEIVR